MAARDFLIRVVRILRLYQLVDETTNATVAHVEKIGEEWEPRLDESLGGRRLGVVEGNTFEEACTRALLAVNQAYNDRDTPPDRMPTTLNGYPVVAYTPIVRFTKHGLLVEVMSEWIAVCRLPDPEFAELPYCTYWVFRRPDTLGALTEDPIFGLTHVQALRNMAERANLYKLEPEAR